MARKPFVVIDAEILSSSVWQEALHVKVVWLTLLILCDTDGYVGAALPGIATAAGVTLEQAEEAIGKLQAPDSYSRTKAQEGRRIAPAERGWRILNFREHIDRLSRERKLSRERMRRWRDKKKGVTVTQEDVTRGAENIPAPCSFVQSVPLAQSTGMRAREDRPDSPPNPLMGDRKAREAEFLALVREAASLQPDRDPAEIAAEAASYEGAKRQKVNPASMRDDRLLNSILDLRKTVAALKRRALLGRAAVMADPEAEKVWAPVLAKIEGQMDPHTFSSWLRPLLPLSLRDGVLVLARESPSAVSFTRGQFGELIAAAVAPLGVRFEALSVHEPKAKW